MGAIEKAIMSEEGFRELEEYVAITTEEISIPAKIKVNTKRANTSKANSKIDNSHNSLQNTQVDEIMDIDVEDVEYVA